jgi:hypothetical protein
MTLDTAVSYMANRRPHHFARDLDDIVAHGCTTLDRDPAEIVAEQTDRGVWRQRTAAERLGHHRPDLPAAAR